MIDFDDIPSELIVARGQYATVRAALEDAMKAMQSLCGTLAAQSAAILRVVQDGEETAELFVDMRQKLESMETLAAEIYLLQAQKEALKPAAWK